MLCERYFQVRPSSLHSDHFSSLFEAFLVCSLFHSTLGHYQVIRVVHFKTSLYKFLLIFDVFYRLRVSIGSKMASFCPPALSRRSKPEKNCEIKLFSGFIVKDPEFYTN
jgi:hypothetical protein